MTAALVTILHTTTTNAVTVAPQNGVSIQARSSTDFASDTFKKSVDNAVSDNVNYITLIVSVHQTDRNTNVVAIDTTTPTDSSIQAAASYIHSKGAKVSIAVHDDVRDGSWRAYISPSIPSVWFTNYASILNHYAGIAQSASIDEFSIATEMVSMTTSSYTNNWITIITNVRTVYKGSLTYNAQFGGGYADVNTLGFWSSLDTMGISAYYPLNGATTKADIMAQWKKWDQSEITPLFTKYNKPIIFTEIGYVSRDQTTVEPATGYNLTTPINTALQATAYDAALDYFHGSLAVKGMFFWDWSSNPSAGGLSDGNYTPQNKPAELVMKQWFTPGAIAVPAGTYAATATLPATTTKNVPTTDTVAVTTPYSTADALVDIEIYNDSGQRVAQSFSEHQTLSATATYYTIAWTPPNAGKYTVKAGIFSANWQTNLYWNESVSTVTVTDTSVTPPTPPVAPPIPPTTTPTPPAVAPVTPPASLPTAINIWWPSDGSAVAGVQPFKATIDGRDLGTYDMYWQVDNGQLNKMNDTTTDGPHKQADVDLSGWHWAADKKYIITFVTKAKDGSIIATKSTTITIN